MRYKVTTSEGCTSTQTSPDTTVRYIVTDMLSLSENTVNWIKKAYSNRIKEQVAKLREPGDTTYYYTVGRSYRVTLEEL